MKKALIVLMSLFLVVVMAACSSGKASESEDNTLTVAWLPNESGADVKAAREAVGAMIEKATGKKVEHKTTTDYIIAIESIANGSADIAFLGAQGYIEAHNKNEKVLPLVVPSGESGTIEDAVYHSWIAVKQGNEAQYKDGDKFSIENIAGKSFSFVSTSSTSGFKVPSAGIVSHFSKEDKYKDLKAEDLLKGGKFFDKVLFGNSHQGSAVNLLSGKAEVAAFCDTCVANYVELSDGEHNKAGAVYKVKEDAAQPFDKVIGEKFVLVSDTPVLNAPFTVNTENVSDKDRKALVEAFTSDEVANNEDIFVPEDSKKPALFTSTGKERFVKVEDSWFDPIRELSK
ncbi:phosphate/phosphite/phosphonate ABC transporter substrate-binding protein [Pseudalkalibacillus decolorationis]|uniref:phosphate/phosphite/phosphonate ABC transporter substrate-binding protein n=1 Tax=Pseudalkalibacillus decolorationis TaxID=163879 RepID=UPI00214933B6|nr:phosphate/phosphite/phosphonate ABC transporter substrate-binding protein [Pseudalkalibacillus decolorationis]